MEFKVIKPILHGWEIGAETGEILTVKTWNGFKTLVNKEGLAVCDLESEYEKECCERIPD